MDRELLWALGPIIVILIALLIKIKLKHGKTNRRTKTGN
jgi:hypothetical protein